MDDSKKHPCYTQETGFTLVEFPIEWPDKVEFEEYLKMCGFNTTPKYRDAETEGSNIYAGLKIWGRSEKTKPVVEHPYEYIAELDDTSYPTYILIPDTPSMLAFRIAIAPLTTSNAASYYLSELNLKIEKLFRASHGHFSYEVCQECDPVAYADLQKARRERLKKATP